MVKSNAGHKGDPIDSGAESIFSSKQTVDTSKQSYEPQHGPKIKDNYHARTVDIWALGITIVIGGQYFNWNKGLTAGFGSYAIATFLIGTAYICLCLCTSELSSALPFAGGGYGLARVTLGFYAGFMVGCFEIMEYILYTADSCLSLGSLIAQVTGMDPKYSPLVWLAFYISAVWIYCVGGKIFWRVSNVLAFLSITILLIYAFGSAKFVNFRFAEFVSYSVNADKTDVGGGNATHVGARKIMYNNLSILDTTDLTHSWFQGGFIEFMRVLPLAGWFYVGIESLNFASNDISNPKRNIPISVMSCMITLFCTSIVVLFISCSLPVGIESMASTASPLNRGFQLMFNITDLQATIFSIPATYATAFGFIFSYGRLIVSMSESRLLPRILRLKWGDGKSGTPSIAFIVGSGISYCICIMVYFFPAIEPYIFNVCILCAFGAYTSQFIGYINLRTRFADLPRIYRSPLGIFGALLGIVIFLLAAISVIGFQEDNQLALVIVVFIAILTSMYYFLVAKHQQKFSRDELKTLFNAHVFKLNCQSNKFRLNRAKQSAKRTQKKSYDSDRNSFSGDDGYYDRNSSESLNAAMRSIVQKSYRRMNNMTNNRNMSIDSIVGAARRQSIMDDNYSVQPEFDFASASVATGPLDIVHNENMIIANDTMATLSLTKLAAKSLPKMLFNNGNIRRVGVLRAEDFLNRSDSGATEFQFENFRKVIDGECKKEWNEELAINTEVEDLGLINGASVHSSI